MRTIIFLFILSISFSFSFSFSSNAKDLLSEMCFYRGALLGCYAKDETINFEELSQRSGVIVRPLVYSQSKADLCKSVGKDGMLITRNKTFDCNKSIKTLETLIKEN